MPQKSTDNSDQTLRKKINSKKLFQGSTFTCVSLTVVHLSCWTALITLGGVAIKNRNDFGSPTNFFGSYGTLTWVSIPFFPCAIFSMIVLKTDSRQLISYFMLISSLAFIFAVSLLVYCAIALQSELLSANFNQIIVTSIAIAFIIVEITASAVSCGICFLSIRFKLQLRKKTQRKSRKSQIRPADVEPNLVTVMALPPREAAELFLALYKPYTNSRPFMTVDGFAFGDFSQYATDNSGATEYRRHSFPEERRRSRRRQKRSMSRMDSSEDSPSGYIPDIEDTMENDAITFDQKSTPGPSGVNTQTENPYRSPQKSYSQGRHLTVHEDSNDQIKHKTSKTSEVLDETANHSKEDAKEKSKKGDRKQ